MDDVARLDRADVLDREQNRWSQDAERLRQALVEAEQGLKNAESVRGEANGRFEETRTEERGIQRRLDDLRAKHASALRMLETGAGSPEAAERQRQNCEHLIDEAETQMLELLETQDAARAALELAKSKVEQAERVLNTARKELPPRIDEAAAAATRLQAELEGVLGDLPPDLRSRYKGLREKGRWPVARIKDASCSACSMTAPPQTMVELKRGRLMSCHGCHRWLLLPTDSEKV
ncbi:MAG: hypothetical protein H6738_14110 [Alphaproteobacteria bacterium]|nr:hypothetical protein [Alphaproteobacteria bacterium]MCB9697911.1 hypothetical protein [Alphaproteobacteria bacterium]